MTTNIIDLHSTPEPEAFDHDFRAADDIDVEIIARYVYLKTLAREIENEIKALQPQVTDLVLSQPDEAVARFDSLTFRVYYRKKYEYPPHVEAMEHELKCEKKKYHRDEFLTEQRAVLQMSPLKS